jgi:uroporphyrinogen III methyltransferase / synthase
VSVTRTTARKPAGRVVFVGTGPGDPTLLTLRAVDALAAADIVVLDQLLRGEAVLRHCRPGVEVVEGSLDDEGRPLGHAARARRVVEAARTGRAVVRLMDGDPGTYNGLPEEAAACRKARVAVEVVPGVSALSAVPAYAGIPLTDAKSRSLQVVSTESTEPDWALYGGTGTTVVVLGPPARLPGAAAGLLAAGRPASTPVAVTSRGTTTWQRTVVSSLGALAHDLDAADLAAPVLAVVGAVVGHREALSWYESKPLFGWRVLVPRTKEQAGTLADHLRASGAVPEEVPTISVEPPRTPQQMERAVRGLVTGRYEWVAFTSTNAVRAVRERFEEYGLDARAFAGIKVAAVGEQTAKALLDFGVRPDLVPSGEQSAAGLVEDWPPYDSVFDPIDRVFLPRADIATDTLVAGLRQLGWQVDDVTAYRTVRAAPPAAEVRDAIKAGGFDAVVFTSSSTVRNLVGIAGKPHPSTVIAVIGPQTARTAEEHGLRVDVLAPTPSMPALVAALAEFGAARRAGLEQAGESVTRPSDKRPPARRKAK